MATHNHRTDQEVRKLAAIMFTDISGYTKMMGRDEEKGLELVRKNREIHKPLIEKFHGKWIKEMGDGELAQFDSAYHAIKCAIEIQKRAKKELKGKLRIGLHIGEIIIENEDIFGDGVNVAARIESLTEPGGIFFSETFFKAIQGRADIRTRYIGEISLKNVDLPVKIYCAAEKDLAIPGKERIRQLRKRPAQERITFRNFFKRPVFYIMVIFFLTGLFTVRNWYLVKPTRTIQAIAVLPFSNLTGNEDEQYFVDMMHDAVITEISKIGDLIVKSRTSTLQFKNTKQTIPEIARILKVDALLESSVYKTGDSVYLNFQLIKTRPVEDHIWAQDYKRDTRHILSLYGELAKSVAREVEIQLTPLQEKLLTHTREVNPEAYKAYLNGQFHWNKLTKADLDIAENYFNLAKEIDPDYPLSYVGLASVGLGRAQQGLVPWRESAINCATYIEKALDLDSTLYEVHDISAGFNCWALWNFDLSRKEYDKAIQYNPNAAKTRVYYGHVLLMYHEYEAAIKQGELALKLDPFNNLVKGIFGMTLNNCREYERADSFHIPGNC